MDQIDFFTVNGLDYQSIIFTNELATVEQFMSQSSYFNLWPLNPLSPIPPTGQLIAATTEEIVKAYYPSYFLLAVAGQIQTRQVQGNYDDSYLGEKVHFRKCVTEYWQSSTSVGFLDRLS